MFSIQVSSTEHPWLKVIYETPNCSVMFTSRGDINDESSTYGEFNICHYTGDASAHVSDCRRCLAKYLDVPVDHIVLPRQIHSTKILTLTSLPVDAEILDGVDGVVTNLRRIAIGVSTADCVPVIAIDERKAVIGAFHAGWRGAVGGVVENGIDAMLALGASIDGIKIFIGPSICGKCFEVGEEVATSFPEECVIREEGYSKPHVDLPGYVSYSLLRLGVKEENISEFNDEMCTRCHPDRYFSARAIGINSGRNFTFAIMR